ncbi:MAG: hypothetical protein ACI9UO_002604, partial [Nitrospinales bacterium]
FRGCSKTIFDRLLNKNTDLLYHFSLEIGFFRDD